MITNLPFKLGKLPAKIDARALKMRDFLRAPKPLPTSYSVDIAMPGCVPRMYLNDTYGDCAMACQAELQDRIVLKQTGKPAGITDAEVKKQYFKETGGEDSGLVLVDMLKVWHKTGWIAGGKKHQIEGFANVDWHNLTEVKTAIMLCLGLVHGVQLPEDAMSDFMKGKSWTSTKYEPDPEGGHCVYPLGWEDRKTAQTRGIRLLTWGGITIASYDWFLKYTDESKSVVPKPDNISKAQFDHTTFNREKAKAAA